MCPCAWPVVSRQMPETRLDKPQSRLCVLGSESQQGNTGLVRIKHDFEVPGRPQVFDVVLLSGHGGNYQLTRI